LDFPDQVKIKTAMIQSLSQLIDVAQFIEQYGDHDQFELIDGELVEKETWFLYFKRSAISYQLGYS
jgi:hypothetical protein